MTEKIWDDKFGMIEKNKDWTSNPLEEDRKVIEGVGADAEIITNAAGGKQSKSPMAMHLVDPHFLQHWAEDNIAELEEPDRAGEGFYIRDENLHNAFTAISEIAEVMLGEPKAHHIFEAIYCLSGYDEPMVKIAQVLQYGADRYEANNWRLIPEEEHINHALVHLIAAIAGDTQDDHIDHALCRLMMAYATDKSPNFDYNRYIPKAG